MGPLCLSARNRSKERHEVPGATAHPESGCRGTRSYSQVAMSRRPHFGRSKTAHLSAGGSGAGMGTYGRKTAMLRLRRPPGPALAGCAYPEVVPRLARLSAPLAAPWPAFGCSRPGLPRTLLTLWLVLAKCPVPCRDLTLLPSQGTKEVFCLRFYLARARKGRNPAPALDILAFFGSALSPPLTIAFRPH